MPIFTFQCENEACKQKFDDLVLQGEDESKITCPKCKSATMKIFSGAVAISFKGSGWTEKFNRDSTPNLKDHTQLIKEEAKSIKAKELYNDVTRPIDVRN